MRKSFLLPGLAAALFPGSVTAQSVPEGIHSDATGPAEMCGLSGRDARELMYRVRASPTLRRSPIESDRFEIFESADPSAASMDQWALTRPTEPAYPSVTCRHAYQQGGNWYQTRNMRCDAGRAACDHLFIEFQQLDQQMIEEIRNRVGGGAR